MGFAQVLDRLCDSVRKTDQCLNYTPGEFSDTLDIANCVRLVNQMHNRTLDFEQAEMVLFSIVDYLATNNEDTEKPKKKPKKTIPLLDTNSKIKRFLQNYLDEKQIPSHARGPYYEMMKQCRNLAENQARFLLDGIDVSKGVSFADKS